MPDQRSSIDEQVVKMSFDNSNFDSNINDSINALNNLDTKLGLLNKEDFADLKNNISNLANVFTAKGQIMLGVFTSLGKKIVDVGLQLKNKLFAGIKDGLSEYNMIIDSTQTIYQNVKQSGATIKDVNYALDELNEYADLTIYNFSEMTRMIGMFTSAGVSLNKSVATIKGLANAAALVGANSEKAQIAWQAVSRAMSSGQFTNVVWRSLELSNIAGKQFNKVIEDVARANNVVGKSGKNIDEMIEKYGSLRLTLSEGWLTKDIFAEAMQIMSGDLNKEQLMAKGYSEKIAQELEEIGNSAKEAATQVKTFRQLIQTIAEAIGSGWAQSFRILIGDLDEAKRLFTRINVVISDFIDNNAKIRNELFTQIVRNQKDQNTTLVEGLKTGRENFEQTIENMTATVKTFFKAVSTGFLNIFPIERISAAAVKVLDVVQKATRALVLNQEELGLDSEGNEKVLGWDTDSIHAITEGIRDLIKFFRGLASAVDIAWMAFSQPIKAIVQRIPFFQNFFDKTNGGLLGILKKMGSFGDKITVVRNAFRNSNIIEQAVGMFIDNIDEIGKKYPILGALLSIFKGIKNGVIAIKDAFQKLDIKPLSVLFGAFKFVVEGLWKILNFVFGLLRDAKNNIDWSFLDGPKQAIIGFIKKLSDYGRGLISFEELTGKIGEAFKKVFAAISSLFSKNKIKTGTGEIQKSFTDLGETVNTLSTKIKKIGENIKKFLTPIAEFFKNADWSLEGIVKKIGIFAGGIGSATLGITVLAKELGKRKIIDNINDLLSSGVDVVKAYQKQIESKMIINIAIAIGILAAAMVVLAFVPYEKLENGLVIFSSFMATIALTLTPVITALAKFNESLGKTKKALTEADVLNNLVNKLGKMGQTLANSLYNKMLGEMLKDLAISILILVGAIAALVLMFTLNADSTERAVNSIINLIVALSGAVFIMAFALEALSRAGKQTRTASDAFKMFFTLSGIAAVITSFALAIAILVESMAKLATIDRWALNKNMDEFKELLWSMAGVSAVLLIIIGVISKFSEFKRTTVGIPLIILSIAAAVAILSYSIAKIASIKTENLKRVFDNMMKLVALVGLIAFVITGTIGLTRQLKEFTSSSVGVIATLAAVTGMIYVLSKIEHIDDSVIATISILAGALTVIVSVVSLLAIITAKSGSAFSTDFVRVIKGIALSITAVVASIGLLTIGITSLIYTLSKMDLSESDVNKASNTLVSKLKTIANTIKSALPELGQIFYNMGRYVATMFTYFAVGFADNLVTTGDMYLSIADKLVNLIIDILAKVTGLLKSRKSDVAKIIRNVVEFIGAVITEAVNDVFKSNSDKKFTEDQVLKFLGFAGLTAGGGKAIFEMSKNFNAAATSVTNLKNAFEGIEKAAGGSFSEAIDAFGFADGIKYLNTNLVHTIGNFKIIKGLGNGIAKLLSKITGTEIKFDNTSDVSLGKTVAALGAVVVAIGAVKLAIKGLRQQVGKEARYIRSDLETTQDKFEAFFTDSEYRSQSLIDTMTIIGEILASAAGRVSARILDILYLLLQIPAGLTGAITDILSFIDPKHADIYNSISDYVSGYVQAFHDAADELRTTSDYTMAHLAEFKYDPNIPIVDGAKLYEDNYDAGKLGSEGLVDGSLDGLSDYSYSVSKKIRIQDIEILKNWNGFWKRHSPSKVTLELYKDIMNGCLAGLAKGSGDVYHKIQEINQTELALTIGGAAAITNAWNQILKANGWNMTNSLRNVKMVITDLISGQEKTVYLNQALLETFVDNADAFENMTRGEAKLELQRQAELKGLAYSQEELWNVIDAAFGYQEDKTKLSIKAINELDNATTTTMADIEGERKAAEDAVISNYLMNFKSMLDIADSYKELLIGKKRDEVEEILYQEAVKNGMTEEAARTTSKNLAAILFAGKKVEEKISEGELKSKIQKYGEDVGEYSAAEGIKTKILQEQARLRQHIEDNPFFEFDAKMASHEWGIDQYREAQKKYAKDYEEYVNQINQINKLEQDVRGYREDSIDFISSGFTLSGQDFSTYWADQYEEALELIGDSSFSLGGTITDLFNMWRGMLNLPAPDLDFGSWDFESKFGDTDNLGLGDDDISSAVDAAADLKDGLESQRADLTPTFDLDQLASDANKATGIVMSSLMAAQNASIGDYINKDSELNPFMKDRWQNVYNFTQNNYSPKALSRIDIYRQTQRQISMSRGF